MDKQATEHPRGIFWVKAYWTHTDAASIYSEHVNIGRRADYTVPLRAEVGERERERERETAQNLMRNGSNPH